MYNNLVHSYVSIDKVCSVLSWIYFLSGCVVFFVLYNYLSEEETYRIKSKVNSAISLEVEENKIMIKEHVNSGSLYGKVKSANTQFLKDSIDYFLSRNKKTELILDVFHSSDLHELKLGIAQSRNTSIHSQSYFDYISKLIAKDDWKSRVFFINNGGNLFVFAIDYLDEKGSRDLFFSIGKEIDDKYLSLISHEYGNHEVNVLVGQDGFIGDNLDDFIVYSRVESGVNKTLLPVVIIMIITFFSAILATRKILSIDTIKRKRVAESLISIASVDYLTQIPNRRKFFDLGEDIFNSEKSFCVMMIDLDFFKSINDSFGHDAGDKVLVNFTKECRSEIRENDIFARVGGEEFGLVILCDSRHEALKIAERIRAKVSETHILYKNNKIKITASIGLSMFDSQNSFEEIINHADKAMYIAKETGRNKVILYHDRLVDQSIRMSI